MLVSLRIRNLALIEDLAWELGPGFNTLTGETGAGKSILVDALALLKRFGSVTVLNGHIHQVVQKVEGNMTFYTARSTSYPQPAPGTAPAPGPPPSAASPRAVTARRNAAARPPATLGTA